MGRRISCCREIEESLLQSRSTPLNIFRVKSRRISSPRIHSLEHPKPLYIIFGHREEQVSPFSDRILFILPWSMLTLKLVSAAWDELPKFPPSLSSYFYARRQYISLPSENVHVWVQMRGLEEQGDCAPVQQSLSMHRNRSAPAPLLDGDMVFLSSKTRFFTT